MLSARRQLNFGDDHRFRMLAEQLLRSGVCRCCIGRKIQAQVGCVRIELAQDQRFPGLPGAGNKHGWKLVQHAPKQIFRVHFNPHADNVRPRRKLCKHKAKNLLRFYSKAISKPARYVRGVIPDVRFENCFSPDIRLFEATFQFPALSDHRQSRWLT